MTPRVPDYGHHEADKELMALIRRLHLSYRQARISLQEKIEDYLNQFEKQDFLMRALYDSGELSHEDYMKWKYSTLAGTKQWKNMLNQLADDLTHQNEIAASMIDDTLPGVYALNHNYGTFEAEKGSGYDTTYTLYDKNVVKRLLTEHEDLLPHPSVPIEKDLLWNRQHLQSALLQGILTGESMSDIAKRFQSVTDMTERAAMRNARTAVTGAENAGRIDSYIRAEKMGIKMQQMWMATLDGRTRDSHAIMDGEHQEVGKKFSNGCRYPGDPSGAPAEVYNCFVGDTKIATDSEIIRSYKHDYSGKLVTIKTASGVEFTCTPNHPIFTPSGWIGANLLHKGDNIFITFVSNEHLARCNPNVDHVFSRIDAIHNLFNVIGCKRVSGLSVNFHGDIPTSEVEVVTHKRFLKDDRNSILSKESKKFIFKSTDSFTFRNSHLMKSSRRILVSSFSFMSRLRKTLSFFWSCISHSGKHCFGTVSESNSAVFQSQSDNMSGNIQFSSDGFDRPSCKVFIDNIIDIKISTVSHVPVYNLQTEKNYYFVSSIIPDFSEKYNDIPMAIAHNCRCTVVAIVEGADPYSPDLRPSDYLKEQGLTYDEWKQMHGDRYYSKLFKDHEELSENPVVMHPIVNGKDISNTWQRRPDQFAFAIEDVINAQGFDGLPRVVSQAEFDKAVKLANSGNGFIAQRTYSAPDQETLDLYREQLYKGKWYVDCSSGSAMHGRGMYAVGNYGFDVTDTMKTAMASYGSNSPFAYVETFTLENDAKIIKEDDIKELLPDLGDNLIKKHIDKYGLTDEEIKFISASSGIGRIENMSNMYTSKPQRATELMKMRAENKNFNSDILNAYNEYLDISKDNGVVATMFGYDAIDCGRIQDYFVILNRTKVIFKKG